MELIICERNLRATAGFAATGRALAIARERARLANQGFGREFNGRTIFSSRPGNWTTTRNGAFRSYSLPLISAGRETDTTD